MKLDASGTLQWSKTVGGAAADGASCIVQTSDSGYAVAGWTNSFGAGTTDMFIVKLDGAGTLQWSKTVGGTSGDDVGSIIQTTEVTGVTQSFGAGTRDMFVVKLDTSGTLQWSRTIGGTGTDVARSIMQTTDGGYAVGGVSSNFGAMNGDFYIGKLDTRRILEWSTILGTPNSSVEIGYSIVQTTDGGFAVAGVKYPPTGGTRDMFIVEYDASGVPIWNSVVGGTNTDSARSIVQTPDGGYLVAGSTVSFASGSNDIYIAKLDAGGVTCANFTSSSPIYGVVTPAVTIPTPTVTTPPPTVTTPTPTVNSGGTVATLCSTVGVNQEKGEIPREFRLEQNYPNPFNPTTTIKYQLPTQGHVMLRVFDVLGREVATLVNKVKAPGSYEVTFDASNLASGVYLYRLSVSPLVRRDLVPTGRDGRERSQKRRNSSSRNEDGSYVFTN